MKKIKYAISFVISALLIFTSFTAFADDAKIVVPTLSSIEFNNATIDREFDPMIYEYTITLDDNTKSPTLKSCKVDWDSNVFITYKYDNTNHQTGIIATVLYSAGSLIYTFNYSNPTQYKITSNNHLSSVYCEYGELSPSINNSDTSYKLYIPKDMTELSITPVTADINSYCPVINLTLSAEQEPEITTLVTASDGTTRNYKFKIKRVDKTIEDINEEMKDPNYISFVEDTIIYNKPQFIVVSSCVVGGVIVLFILFSFTKKITVNVYDNDEPPFYKV